jgi:hypothetical protein
VSRYQRTFADFKHFIGAWVVTPIGVARIRLAICRPSKRGYSSGVSQTGSGRGTKQGKNAGDAIQGPQTAAAEILRARCLDATPQLGVGMKIGKHALKLAVVCGVAVLTASAAKAGITSVTFASDTSVHNLAQFQGTAEYDSSTGKLSITVENTTAAKTGGYLTAIALGANDPTAAFEDASPTTAANAKFDDLRNKKGIVKAPPYGKYDAGAGIADKWNSNKGAAHGVAAGSGETFVFDVTTANASSLDVLNFLSANKSGQEIVASFRKLSHQHNDRAGAVTTGKMITLTDNGGINNQNQPIGETGLLPLGGPSDRGPASTTAVPLPPAVYMGALTIGLFTMLRRKFRFATA